MRSIRDTSSGHPVGEVPPPVPTPANDAIGPGHIDAWMFESSPDCVKLLDLQGTLLQMNHNGQCLMELPGPGAVIGRKWVALWPQEARPQLERALSAALASQTSRFQAYCPTARGTPKWWDVQVSPVLEPRSGQITHLLSVSRDVTELVQANERIAQLNAELERDVAQRTSELQCALDELEAFSYAVAHDFRAPLTAMRGFSHGLVSEPALLPPRQLHFARRIHLAAVHMDHMAEGILALSKLSRLELSVEMVDLSVVARECVDTLKAAEPQRRVRCTVPSQLWAACDPRLVKVVLQNLLSNAWKFTRQRPDAELEVGSTLGPDNELRYFVRDNGVGFEPQEADKLFQPFYRLRPGEYEGCGIGLTTVRRIVQRHGGSVWASGEVERGATVFFSLAA